MPSAFPLEQLTAEELRRRGQVLQPDSPVVPPISAADQTPAIAGRPSVDQLYEKLNLLNRQPLDYTHFTAVNKARKESSDREMAAGLALSLMGGKHLAGAGNHVLVKALENQNPIRPNEADVGWTNPETGEFVENPKTARTAEEKLITGRVDALIKEQESKARLATDLTTKQAHAAEVQRLEVYKAQMLAALLSKQNNQVPVQDATIGKLDRAGTGLGRGAQLQHAEQKDLMLAADNYSKFDEIKKGFKDEYAGDSLGGSIGSEITNSAVRNFPTALGHFMSPDTMKKAQDKAEWWANQKYFDEMPTRHANFGSALTEQEIKQWNAASIRQGMPATKIKENLDMRADLMQRAAAKMRAMHIANGKNPDAVGAMLDHIPNSGVQAPKAGGSGYGPPPPGAVTPLP
jgi:hypothetical protein